MRFTVSLVLLLLLGISSFSQNYTRDVGIRMGKGFFISYRQFFDEEMAMEAFLGVSRNSFRVSGLREYFAPLVPLRSENLRLVCGYGVHAGIAYTNKYKILNRVYYEDKWSWSPQLGVDGIVGVEYTASEFPVLISAAIQPYFEYSLNHFFSVQPFDFVILIKYRF
jgi:hypothetical protein